MIARLFDNFVSGYFAVCGLAALLGTLVLLRRAVRLSRGERTEGVIVGYTQRMRERRTGPIHYMPRFRFDGPGGEHVVQSRTGTTKPEQLPEGTAVTVLYETENPNSAEIADGARIWWGPAGCLVLATGALVAAWKAGG